jgi:uncharacterized membrane-anchored protein
MSKYLGIAVAGLQVLVLGYMAGEREWVVRTGRTIYLRTAPIDPRDVMRGDYVRLDYEISRVPRDKLRDGLVEIAAKPPLRRPDQRVYAVLRENQQQVAELATLSDQRPDDGLFIRGRLDRWWGSGAIPVRYGLEAYFMEQGRALELEQRVRNRAEIQVPLEMAVAVRSDGLAVLKGHRWSELGIGLELDTTPRDKTGTSRVQGATVRLQNAGEDELAIVDLPAGRSLALVPDDRFGENPWRWVGEQKDVPKPLPEHVIVLQPGQVHAIRVDFADPAWNVIDCTHSGDRAAAQSLTTLNWNWSVRFRLEYRPPSREASQGLPHADLLWHGRLPSRAFTSGRVD